MDFLAECKGINQTILAGCSLAWDNRTHFGSGSACHQAVFSKESNGFFNIIIRNSLDFHTQAGCHSDLAISEFVCCICNGTVFICGNMSISCDDPNIKDVIISFVLKTSQTLYPFDFLGTQFWVVRCYWLFLIHDSVSPLYSRYCSLMYTVFLLLIIGFMNDKINLWVFIIR